MRDFPRLRGRSQALLICRISWEHAQGGARVWVPFAGRGRVQPGPGVTPQGLGFRTSSHGKPTCPAVQRTPRAQAAPPLYGLAGPRECLWPSSLLGGILAASVCYIKEDIFASCMVNSPGDSVGSSSGSHPQKRPGDERIWEVVPGILVGQCRVGRQGRQPWASGAQPCPAGTLGASEYPHPRPCAAPVLPSPK